jgi:hypothetical protein
MPIEVFCKLLNLYIIQKGHLFDFFRHIPLKSDHEYYYFSNYLCQSIFTNNYKPIIGFKINRKNGEWFDLLTNTSGIDLIDLIKYQKNISRENAFFWLLKIYKPKQLLFLLN